MQYNAHLMKHNIEQDKADGRIPGESWNLANPVALLSDETVVLLASTGGNKDSFEDGGFDGSDDSDIDNNDNYNNKDKQ